jgi:hypothetical protein
MPSIDIQNLRSNILKNSKLKLLATNLAESKIENEKSVFLENFNSHPVTLEIESGESASNISGTLGGYGNLFSFIGFLSGSDPIRPIRELIKKTKLIRSSVKLKIDKSNFSAFSFSIFVPKKSDFEQLSKMPWATGRSWLFDIERGISGFGSYLNQTFLGGRSGKGLQLNKKIRSYSFKNTSYFGRMYSNFLKKINFEK